MKSDEMTDDGNRIRVLCVDDHELMRSGIRFVLLAFDDLQFVGEASSGEGAIARCGDTQPHVVLLDMRMPGLNGIETTARIRSKFPDIQVLILNSFHDYDLVRRSMEAGAVGYLLKDASKDNLAAAIRAAAAGQLTLASDANKDLNVESEVEVLTDREQTVLELLAKGFTNKQIGKQLHLSPYTVRHHVSQLIRKLGVSNRAAVVATALQLGLIR